MPVADDLRSLMAAHLRASWEEYWHDLGFPLDEVARSPRFRGELDRADALDRGAPVVFAAWELPRWSHSYPPDAWLRLDPDGALVEVSVA